MNEKEIAELRRRYRSDRTNISRIYGCFVNEKKEIISDFEQSLGSMSEDDADEMLKILKRVFSGTIGKNLHEIEFSTAQVSDSEDYRLIYSLKEDKLSNAEARGELFSKIAGSLELEGNYMILLAHDAYDVFDYGADGEKNTESNKVFSYIGCAICPTKAVFAKSSASTPKKTSPAGTFPKAGAPVSRSVIAASSL